MKGRSSRKRSAMSLAMAKAKAKAGAKARKKTSKSTRATSATATKKSPGKLVAGNARKRSAGVKKRATAAKSTRRSVLEEIKSDVARVSREIAALATEVKALNEWKHLFTNTAEGTDSNHRQINVSMWKQGPEGFEKVSLSGAGPQLGFEGRLRELESKADEFAYQIRNALIIVNRFENKMGGNPPRDSGPLKSSMGIISDDKPSPIDSNAVSILKSK